MDFSKTEGAIEAILFSVGEAVPLNKIAEAVKLEPQQCREIIHSMMAQFNEQDRGIQIVELEDSFQMCTKQEFYEEVKAVTHKIKEITLTDVLIETLSIIAYKQPITKAHIEGIRGVNCNHAVNRLVEYELVCEVGRLDAPGRPILFGTTKDFLRAFGLQSMNELPEINPLQLSHIQAEVEEEVDHTINNEQGVIQ